MIKYSVNIRNIQIDFKGFIKIRAHVVSEGRE